MSQLVDICRHSEVFTHLAVAFTYPAEKFTCHRAVFTVYFLYSFITSSLFLVIEQTSPVNSFHALFYYKLSPFISGFSFIFAEYSRSESQILLFIRKVCFSNSQFALIILKVLVTNRRSSLQTFLLIPCEIFPTYLGFFLLQAEINMILRCY